MYQHAFNLHTIAVSSEMYLRALRTWVCTLPPEDNTILPSQVHRLGQEKMRVI